MKYFSTKLESISLEEISPFGDKFFFNNEEGTKYLGFSLKKENGRIVDFLGYPVPTGKRININNEWYNYRPVVSPFTDDMKKIYLRKNNGRNNRKSKSKNNTNQLKSK